MSRSALMERVNAAPGGRLEIFIVLSEDAYETRYGDGYYAYFADAFCTRVEAYDAIGQLPKGQRYHIRKAVLSSEGGELRMEAELAATEKAKLEDVVAALEKKL